MKAQRHLFEILRHHLRLIVFFLKQSEILLLNADSALGQNKPTCCKHTQITPEGIGVQVTWKVEDAQGEERGKQEQSRELIQEPGLHSRTSDWRKQSEEIVG